MSEAMGRPSPRLEYRLVENSHPTTLEKTVRDWIDDGWEPLGGVSVHSPYGGDSSWYVQAMIRRKP